MPLIDPSTISRILQDIGAAEIMPRFRKLAAGDIEMKGVNDPVTIADKETERRLTEELTRALPGSVAVGEESFAKDKSIMARVDSADPVWIIDPIDGTRNFVSGQPEFGIMVALIKHRQTVASWIHDPNSGDTIMAEQGAGVWLRGRKLRLAARDDFAATVGLVGARIKKYISSPDLMPSGKDIPATGIGSCAAFDYPRLFAGDVNFAGSGAPRAGFLFYRHTNAWDHVPGLFMLYEAGGYSADWSGQPYDMTKPRSGLLCAPDKEIWEHLYQLFQPLMRHTQNVES